MLHVFAVSAGFLLSSSQAATCPKLDGEFSCENQRIIFPMKIRTRESEDFVAYYITKLGTDNGIRADGIEYPIGERGWYKAVCAGESVAVTTKAEVDGATLRSEEKFTRGFAGETLTLDSDSETFTCTRKAN